MNAVVQDFQNAHGLGQRPSEVIYEIYPASFADSNGDGHGDLRGITGRLDYLKSLNVDAIWIAPFFLSPDGPDGDGGYAVTDHCQVAPRFGTMDDFTELLNAAHKRGLRVYTDYVLCHTAADHEWFEKSRKREPGFENHYVWHDGKIEHGVRIPPNNWKSVFGGPAWTLEPVRDQWYLRHFNSSQPALNLNDQNVQGDVLNKMKFWLDKGVDGFRLDALPFANYDPQFRNNPWLDGQWPRHQERWEDQYFEHSLCQDETVRFAERIRRLLDSYPDRKTALGEAIAGREGGRNSMDVAASYVDRFTGLHMCYTESLISFYEYPQQDRLKTMVKDLVNFFPDGGNCNSASNHDFPRAATRMTTHTPEAMRGDIIRQLMRLYISLPGSFCMYQGEELGLSEARIPEDVPLDKRKDLLSLNGFFKCRDGARTPMPWESCGKNAGFSTSEDPYLPVAEAHYLNAVDAQEEDPESMLNFTRRLLEFRQKQPALMAGVTEVLDTPAPILAYLRKTPGHTMLCVFNLGPDKIEFQPAHYLDAQTLNAIKLPRRQAISLNAYGSSFQGVVAPTAKLCAVPAPAPK